MTDEAGWPLGLPQSQAEIEGIQRVRKRVAVERARQSKLLAPRVSGIDLDHLDDPEEWRKIPVLTNDELRKLSPESLYRDFAIRPASGSTEVWRAGGEAEKPLFYPRSAEDVRYALGVSFRRVWPCIGARRGDIVHVSLPLGMHPAGQIAARSAQLEGLATVWAGAGVTTPSVTQLELIRDLRPAILAAMPSYALHLANLAESLDIDVRQSGVRKLLVGAEPLSEARRARLQRQWNATVYNSFSTNECGMAAVERDGVTGMLAWSDLYLFEVVDPSTGQPVADGEAGALVMTPLWTNTITPFLRWYAGDRVALRRQARTADPFSVFPVLERVFQTDGFFELRGMRIDHGELEDFMLAQDAVTDFRAEAQAEDGRDVLTLRVEIRREAEPLVCAEALRGALKARFELTPAVEVLETGTLARDFEQSVKPPRFVDKRHTP